MARFRVTISSRNGEAIRDLVRVHKIAVSDHGARYNEDVGFLVHAVVSEAEIDVLRTHGYVVETRSLVGGPSA